MQLKGSVMPSLPGAYTTPSTSQAGLLAEDGMQEEGSPPVQRPPAHSSAIQAPSLRTHTDASPSQAQPVRAGSVDPSGVSGEKQSLGSAPSQPLESARSSAAKGTIEQG